MNEHSNKWKFSGITEQIEDNKLVRVFTVATPVPKCA